MSEVLKKMDKKEYPKIQKRCGSTGNSGSDSGGWSVCSQWTGTAEHHYDPGYRSKDAGRDRSDKL